MRLRKLHLFACLSTVAAVIAAPTAVLVSGASASTDLPAAPATAKVALTVPATVTDNGTVDVTARLTLASLALSNRSLQFVSRPVGASTWSPFANVTTDAQGLAHTTSLHLTSPTEIGAYYADATGAVHSDVTSSVVHVIDVATSAPKVALVNATVVVKSRLVEDRVHGVSAQLVKMWLRVPSAPRWSAPLNARTNSAGIATVSRRLTRTTQVGVQFLGANGVAPSPMRIVTIVVKPRPAAAVRHARRGGIVFPFANPSQAQSVGAWTLDQGVDIAANGYACGASAVLVAISDGVVIQEGISGFGPTAPVIRMTSGPLAGRNVYYGHTGHVYVRVGAHVRAGQPVAQIGCGSVGYSDVPHVEIGVGVPGGPPCCPAFHQTASLMYRLLLAALRG